MRPLRFGLPQFALAFVSALYLASLTPHLYPYGDNATYILLSRGLLAHGRYCLPISADCAPHVKFPFVFPMMLVPITAVADGNVLLMNLLTTIVAVLAVWSFYRLVRPIVGEPGGVFLLLAVGLSPLISEYTHRVMAELPYLFFTLAGIRAAESYRRQEGWLTRTGLVAGGFLVLAALTRTIGLFTALAIALSLLFHGRPAAGIGDRIRKTAVVLAMVVVPSLLWGIRNSVVGPSSGQGYFGIFLLRNLYAPDLGNVTWADLGARAVSNGVMYAQFLASAVSASRYVTLARGATLMAITFTLCVPAIVGLAARVLGRERSSIEYATLAYIAVILVYVPEPRLLIPAIPFLFLYTYVGARTLYGAARHGSRWARGAAAGALAATAVLVVGHGLATQVTEPSGFELRHWLVASVVTGSIAVVAWRVSRRSRPRVVGAVCLSAWLLATLAWHVRADIIDEHREPYYYRIASFWGEFVDMTTWVRDNTPEGTVVLCRKPGLMCFWSERHAAVYPFVKDRSRILDAVVKSGADYVLVDSFRWTDTTSQYLLPVIESRPDLFELAQQIGKTTLYRVRKSERASPRPAG